MIKVPDGIIESILEGGGLKSVMIPDSSIPSNRPRHTECYRFHHLLLRGDYLWAMTRKSHVMDRERAGYDFVNCSFAYSMGIENIFSTIGRDVVWMPMERYESFEWKSSAKWKQVWDSDDPKNMEEIRKSIENGSKIKIHLLDDEEFWNIHPIDLAQLTDEGNFILRTEPHDYPFLFREPEQIREKMIPQIKPIFEMGKTAESNVPIYRAYYCLYNNGSYYNFFDISRDTLKKYKHLKVFTTDYAD